jgi:predicted DNA-binding ribbon-helix-helix protein
MKSAVTKRSMVLNGRQTSVTLEDVFWTELKEIAYSQGVTVSNVIAAIDATRKQSNLPSTIRIFVLEHLRNKDKSAGPRRSAQPNEIRSTHAWRGYPRRG